MLPGMGCFGTTNSEKRLKKLIRDKKLSDQLNNDLKWVLEVVSTARVVGMNMHMKMCGELQEHYSLLRNDFVNKPGE